MYELQFIERFETEKSLYEAWGNYVKSELYQRISTVEDISQFLKIPLSLRVKDTNSLLAKAFYRGKDYQNPYEEITDKVGVRLVVLLVEDIEKVCQIVEGCELWEHSKDKDFEVERLENPTIFDYQSVHYIVKSKTGFTSNGIVINKGLPCEIQIRTLLQHAYSEIAHDITYKPKTQFDPKIHRFVARSMALIETTDDLFGEVNCMVQAELNKYDDLLLQLSSLYKTLAQPEYEKSLNLFILDGLEDILKDLNIDSVREFVIQNKYLEGIISSRYSQSLLYRQPLVLLLFYLISIRIVAVKNLWPLPEKDLRPLYIDLGVAFD